MDPCNIRHVGRRNSTIYLLEMKSICNATIFNCSVFQHGAMAQGSIRRDGTNATLLRVLTNYLTSLYSYFGHGTGRQFLKGHDIQRLDCRAASLLMGCSSGKLQVRVFRLTSESHDHAQNVRVRHQSEA